MACVWAVGYGIVCDRVTRVKSSKRRRSTTVRPARPAARIRRVTRSTSAARVASIRCHDVGRRPSACWAPIERRLLRGRTRRGSRLWARACSWRPTARPSIDTRSASVRSATSRTVVMPSRWSLADVAGPTPHSRSTGSGCRKASSASGGTTSSPSGFATALATLARNFVRATPTVIGRPTRSSTSRFSRTAIWAGVPVMCSRPRTSRKASSMDRPSTTGAMSSNTRYTALLASE